jgi:hypothetical protein
VIKIQKGLKKEGQKVDGRMHGAQNVHNSGDWFLAKMIKMMVLGGSFLDPKKVIVQDLWGPPKRYGNAVEVVFFVFFAKSVKISAEKV